MGSQRQRNPTVSPPFGASPFARTLSLSRTIRCDYSLGAGVLADLAACLPPDATRVVVVADRRVAGHHLHTLQAALAAAARPVQVVTFAPGEASKTRRTALRLADAALAPGLGRNDVVVGFGGGVALDLAGVVAALTLRGLPLVQVPTSLLAAVDASIGGKAAVDTPLGKNLLGAFWWPRAVLVEPAFLATLAASEVRNGLAEGVKHAVLGAPDLFERLERFADTWDGAAPPAAPLLAALASVKLDVVARDPFEEGERRTLNLGHTVAHALEAASGFTLAHGAAVAIGLGVEGRVARELCGFPDADLQRIRRLLARLGLPLEPAYPFAEAWPSLQRDKKALAGRVHLSLPRRLGEMEAAGGRWAVEVPRPLLEACWHERP